MLTYTRSRSPVDALETLAWDVGDRRAVERVAKHLEDGGLLAYPTETVYGLGAAATSDGVRRLRSLKERGPDKPFIILLPEPAEEHAPDLDWTPVARRLSASYWPGGLTLALRDPHGRYPEGVRSSTGTVAVRVSSHPFVQALMGVWNRPLLSSSANLPGSEPAMTSEEVKRAVSGGAGVERLWVVDGGRLPPASASSIVDCSLSPPRLIRSGGISCEELVRTVPDLRV